MKKHVLTAFIVLSMMLSCLGVLNSSHAQPQPQSQKISIERAQLVELTKKAEKAALHESESVNLIVENYKLKEQNKGILLRAEVAEANAQLYRKQRNQNRLVIIAFFVAIMASVIIRFLNIQKK